MQQMLFALDFILLTSAIAVLVTSTSATNATVTDPPLPSKSANDLYFCNWRSEATRCGANGMGTAAGTGFATLNGCFDVSPHCVTYGVPFYCNNYPWIREVRCQRSCGNCSGEAYITSTNVTSQRCIDNCHGTTPAQICQTVQDNRITMKVTDAQVQQIGSCNCTNRFAGICDTKKFCVFASYRRRDDPSLTGASLSTLKVCLRHCLPDKSCDCFNQDKGCQSINTVVPNDQWTEAYFEFSGHCKGTEATVTFEKRNDFLDIRQLSLSAGECSVLMSEHQGK